MFAQGAGDDDKRKRKPPCPKCQDYIDHVELTVESVDAIERRLNELKEFFATREWVMIENVANIRSSDNPERDIDLESLSISKAQNVRFKRLVDNTVRALGRIQQSCDEFGGVDENR
jgi:hypothetical protein